jgi:uncharacterized protein (DUF433 family)/DNA-binding transcriptional MerR regulator
MTLGKEVKYSEMMAEEVRAIGHYLAFEVARLAGVSPRRIGQWARAGIIPSAGAKERIYTYADAAEAVLAHYLVEQGLKPKEVRKIVENLRDEWGQWPLATAPIEHEGKLVVVRREGDVYVDVVHRAEQEVIVGTLDLRKVRNALAHGGWVAIDHPREHVEVDPERLSGRPTIRGRRVSTEMVAKIAGRAGGREVLRDEYDLTDDEIDDAVGYEADVEQAVAA